MTNLIGRANELLSGKGLQYQVYAGLAVAVMALAGMGYLYDPLLFQRYFGRVNPLLLIFASAIAGLLLLSFFLPKHSFAIFAGANLGGLLRRSGLAALLGLIAILVDLRAILPASTNLPFPGSLFFYPAIAFFVEIVFHVLPLSLVLAILTALLRTADHGIIIWVSIFIVSLLEPIFQTVAGLPRHYPAWTLVWIALQVFVINICQLIIFKRNDFVAMYAFRLAYYIIWHIVWGHIRLQVLF